MSLLGSGAGATGVSPDASALAGVGNGLMTVLATGFSTAALCSSAASNALRSGFLLKSSVKGLITFLPAICSVGCGSFTGSFSGFGAGFSSGSDFSSLGGSDGGSGVGSGVGGDVGSASGVGSGSGALLAAFLMPPQTELGHQRLIRREVLVAPL